ncbi:hypothetical protein ACIQOW_26940 [Kitasatospora sp. NPDC091335]|uniref:hypothetical protein n=1 Tax=Kitasatospora sp. NPDC091335 TaxID=3364085 RepID=UPI0037F8B1A6
MPRDNVSRLTRVVRAYTGESHQRLRERIEGTPRGQSLIPAARSALQRRLERRAFFTLAWPDELTIYPFGVKSVIPAPDSITLNFEGDHVADHAVQLLPWTRDTEIGGVPGLRVCRTSASGIDLVVAGTSATINVTGISRHAWEQAESARISWLADAGEEMCHITSPHLQTAQERLFERYLATDDHSAWLSSGLLRRIGLFSRIEVPLHFSAWRNPGQHGEQWCFDMDYHPLNGGCQHEAFLSRLTDPMFGLPLTVVRRHCTGDYSWGAQCSIDAKGMGQPGEVNLRFNRRTAERTMAWQDMSPAVMAAKQLVWHTPSLLR